MSGLFLPSIVPQYIKETISIQTKNTATNDHLVSSIRYGLIVQDTDNQSNPDSTGVVRASGLMTAKHSVVQSGVGRKKQKIGWATF